MKMKEKIEEERFKDQEAYNVMLSNIRELHHKHQIQKTRREKKEQEERRIAFEQQISQDVEVRHQAKIQKIEEDFQTKTGEFKELQV
jgi:hypothetical protein